MIASWMLYALSISALVTVAALAVERVLIARGQPTRFVWMAATLLSIAWPLGPIVARLLPAAPRPVRVMPFTIVVDVSPNTPTPVDYALLIDRALIALWVALSVLLAVRLLHGIARVAQTRSAWKRGRVNGVRVKLSDNVGPAVVGLRSMEVVLPEWILTLDEPLRALVLRHEEEHRAARDPYLLFGAAIAVALLPWNAALWFQARRLRLAIEMDCDERVLRAHPSPERYGMLILTIAQRRSMAPALFAPMMTEPTTNLERRIIAMKNRTRRVATKSAIGGMAVAVGMLAFASSLQSAGTNFPTPKVPKAIVQAATAVLPVVLPETIPVKKPTIVKPLGKNEVLKLDSVRTEAPRGNPAPRYPDILKSANVEGAVIVRFSTNDQGRVDDNSISILSSTHPLFSQSVISNLKNWKDVPNQTFQRPFVFVLSGLTGKELGSADIPGGAVVIMGVSDAAGNVAPTVAPAGPTRVSDNQTYFEFQVEKTAQPVAGNPSPRYPDMLRTANVEGEVLAQFVLNTDGTPDMSTFKVLKSTHDLFTASVMSALPNMRFYPASVGGKVVKQVIQMPFQFNLSKGATNGTPTPPPVR